MLSNAMKRHILRVIGDLSVASMLLGIEGGLKHVINLRTTEQNLKIWRFYIPIAPHVPRGVFVSL